MNNKYILQVVDAPREHNYTLVFTKEGIDSRFNLMSEFYYDSGLMAISQTIEVL